jgi:hypothetical protein
LGIWTYCGDVDASNRRLTGDNCNRASVTMWYPPPLPQFCWNRCPPTACHASPPFSSCAVQRSRIIILPVHIITTVLFPIRFGHEPFRIRQIFTKSVIKFLCMKLKTYFSLLISSSECDMKTWIHIN